MKPLIVILILSSLFVSAPAQGNDPVIRFGLIADIQYADCNPSGSRFYRNSLKKLDEAVSHLNKENVQFTINLGDAVDRSFADFDSVLIRLNRLKKNVYNTTGNHDYNGISDNHILYEKLDMKSEYYSFKKKDWVFIMLNTNEIASYANVAGTDREHELTAMLNRIKSSGGRQTASWNGGISREQMEWLDKQLLKAEKAGHKVLIFSHHPLYPESAFSALNNMDILDVIAKYSCVKAVFAGHHHPGNLARITPNNITALTVEGMIETENENAYGIVDIYNDTIKVHGHGRMRSLTAWTLFRKSE